MSAATTVLVAAVGAAVGWWPVTTVVAHRPDPAPVPVRSRIAIALATAASSAVVAARWDRWWLVVPYAAFAAFLVCVSAIDLRTYRIPNAVVFPALAASAVLVAVATAGLDLGSEAGEVLRGAAVGSLVYFALLFVPHLVYPKGMGFGDVKLALVMGLWLGWGRAPGDALAVVFGALFVGSLLGVIGGTAFNLLRRERGAFPFGPALALGCFAVLVMAAGA